MRRLILWSITLLAAVALIAVVIVECVRRSDFPRRTVEAALGEALGAAVRVESLNPRWNGETHIRNLTITPPIDDEPILTLDSVSARHTPLLMVALGSPLTIDSVEIEGGTAALSRDAGGRWNLAKLLAHLPDRPGESATMSFGAKIDAKKIRLRIDAPDREVIEDDLEISLVPAGTADWKFGVKFGAIAHLNGRFASNPPHAHEVHMRSEDVQPWVTFFWPEAPSPIAGDVLWRGEWDGQRIAGTLEMTRARVGAYFATGATGFSYAAGQAVARPDVLRITADTEPVFAVDVLGGNIQLSENELNLSRLSFRAAEQEFLAEGDFDFVSEQGEFKVESNGRWSPMDIEHTSTLSLEIQKTVHQRINAEIDIRSQGLSHWGPWRFDAETTASRDHDGHVKWTASAGKVDWTDPEGIARRYHNLAAVGEYDGRILRVERLSAGGDQAIEAEGHYDTIDGVWKLSFTGDGPVEPWHTASVNLDVQAKGQNSIISQAELIANSETWSLAAKGSYDPARNTPLDSQIDARFQVDAEDHPLPSGAVTADVQVTGTAVGSFTPLLLRTDAKLMADRLVFGAIQFDRVESPITITLDQDAGRINLRNFEWGGGSVSARGEFRRETGRGELHAKVTGIELSRVTAHIDAGHATADVVATFNINDPRSVLAQGAWSIEGFRSGAGVTIDSARGTLRADSDAIHLEDIAAKSGTGVATGWGTVNLTDRDSLAGEAHLENWTIVLPHRPIVLSVSGDVEMDINTSSRLVNARGDLESEVRINDTDAGRLAVKAHLADRRLTVDTLVAQLLDGESRGSGTIELDNPNASAFTLDVHGIEPGLLGAWWPEARHFRGKVSGRVTVASAATPRALEPLRIDAEFASDALTYRDVPLGNASGVAFAGTDRVVVDHLSLAIADGYADLWATVAHRKGQWRTHTQARFDGLDIELLRRFSGDSGTQPIVGRLAGDVRLIGPLDAKQWPTGVGWLELSRCDLLNHSMVGTILRARGADEHQTQPTGEGKLRLRLENRSVMIRDIRYHSRDIEILGGGSIEDLSLGPQSPVDFTLVATKRPLRDWNLPFIKALDETLAAAQSKLTTLRARGTLEDPQPMIVPYFEVTESLGQLFGPRDTDNDQP